MKNILVIDGHKAVIAYDPDMRLFRGEFLGLNGGADFFADSVEGLEREGRISLQEFLAVAQESGIAPYRSYSGKFNVRIPESLHETAVSAAASEGRSLNDWVAQAIRSAAEDASG